MKLSKPSIFLGCFYIVLFFWWIVLSITQLDQSVYNFSFAFAYSFIPLIGGVFGLLSSKKWGFLKSALGKAFFFASLGLITWGLGELLWSYYNFILHIEVPYPSWADALFIVSWPLWTVGTYFLSYATGAKFGLKTKNGRLLFYIVPLIVLIISYYLLVIVARQGSLTAGGPIYKILFDLAYPVGDVVILTVGFVAYGLSFKFLGGRFKFPVLCFLLGFIFNYFADFGFSYTTTVETFYNGNWVDMLFTTALFLMSFGITNIDIKD